MQALASDPIAEILRFVSVISLGALSQTHSRKINRRNLVGSSSSGDMSFLKTTPNQFWRARTVTPPKFRILAPHAIYFAKCCLKKPSVKDSARSASGLPEAVADRADLAHYTLYYVSRCARNR
jgi:hypothetical protein